MEERRWDLQVLISHLRTHTEGAPRTRKIRTACTTFLVIVPLAAADHTKDHLKERDTVLRLSSQLTLTKNDALHTTQKINMQ